MLSLVGYGASSDSEGEEEDGNTNESCSAKDDVVAVKNTRNFLLESGSASSESDLDEPDACPAPPHPPAQSSSAGSASSSGCPKSKKLPPPCLNASSDCSVFANPFRAQAERKLNALQKHVPLTMEAKPAQIGGKKVCVAYRKDGRCRFGIKCKFAHDSDLQRTVTPSQGDALVPVHAEGHPSSQQQSSNKECDQKESKKRKVGLSNSLIPPKKALKQYAMQRDRERINS